MKKNWLNQLEFFKKLTGSVRFYKPETKKTEPNPNRKKPSQNQKKTESIRKTELNQKNRVKPVWTGFCSKKTKLNQNRSVWTCTDVLILTFKTS
jgi:hypothetical protein